MVKQAKVGCLEYCYFDSQLIVSVGKTKVFANIACKMIRIKKIQLYSSEQVVLVTGERKVY